METYKGEGEVDALSLYHTFEQVTDGRKRRGVRYSIALILTLILLGKLAGEQNIKAIAHWIELRKEDLLKQLPVSRERFPCRATYSNVLQKLDAVQLTQIIQQLFTRLEAQRRCGEEPSRLLNQEGKIQKAHVALDGKTLRGTGGKADSEQPAVHLLALYEVKTGLVLAQQQIPDKQNEISAAPALLTPLLLKDRIVSADALHTQRKHCRCIDFTGRRLLVGGQEEPTSVV